METVPREIQNGAIKANEKESDQSGVADFAFSLNTFAEEKVGQEQQRQQTDIDIGQTGHHVRFAQNLQLP